MVGMLGCSLDTLGYYDETERATTCAGLASLPPASSASANTASRIDGADLRSTDDEDVQRARPVYALDATELDVGCGGWAGYERDRLVPVSSNRGELSDCLGEQTHDLIRAHHAQVIIGKQSESAPTLRGATIEHKRAGLGDGQGAPRQHSVARIESRVSKSAVAVGKQLHVLGNPFAWEISRNDQTADTAAAQYLRDRRALGARLHSMNRGPIFGGPLDKESDHHGARCIGAVEIVALPGLVLRARRTAQRGTDASQYFLPVVSHRFARHHSRNVCCATGRRSRDRVHSESAPGKRSIQPSRTSRFCARRPTR